MADLFEEVEGQLRSDRYRALALRAAPWVVGILFVGLLGVLGVWGWRTYEARAVAEASERYAQAIEAQNNGRAAEARRLFDEVAKSRAKAYRSLALMQLGGLKLAERQAADAVKLFDQSAEAAPNPIIGDAARLKSAFALLDSAPYAQVEARLKPLLEDGRPYRAQAREALAFAKLAKGDMAGAREDFQVLTQLLDVAPSARERATAAIQLIDSGSARAVPAAIKAAAALPPAPVFPLGAPAAPPAAAPQPPASGSQ